MLGGGGGGGGGMHNGVRGEGGREKYMREKRDELSEEEGV